MDKIEVRPAKSVKDITDKLLSKVFKEHDVFFAFNKEQIEEAQRRDKQLHTKEQIILRELINYECFYICDFTDAVQPLEAYGYTTKDIQPIFIKYLQKNSERKIQKKS